MHGQFDASLLKLQGSLENRFKDMDEKFKTLRKRLSNDHSKIMYCLDDLGLICANEVCHSNILCLSHDLTDKVLSPFFT